MIITRDKPDFSLVPGGKQADNRTAGRLYLHRPNG